MEKTIQTPGLFSKAPNPPARQNFPSPRVSFRLRLYRWAMGHCFAPLLNWLVPYFFKRGRAEEEFHRGSLDPGVPKIWFHASSLGELESLIPLIEKAVQHQLGAVITIFSASGETHLKRFLGELGEKASLVEWAGYSPWEGNWERFRFRKDPALFVTAKYESWPELWASLAQSRTLLVGVAVKVRRNFLFAKRCLELLGTSLPEMVWITSSESDSEELISIFPEAHLSSLGDPRWDRVAARLKRGNPRAKALVERFRSLPQPWGVLGSVWLRDLEFWDLAWNQLRGTVWVVPHDVNSENLRKIERFLSRQNAPFLRTSDLTSDRMPTSFRDFSPGWILVDERGFLAELYSVAKWAYVGGGFDKGVHSTIEPALSLIPILCGPKNVDKFAEIRLLEGSGQLTIAHHPEEVRNWIRTQLQDGVSQALLEAWKTQIAQQQGSTQRIFQKLQDLLNVPDLSLK